MLSMDMNYSCTYSGLSYAYYWMNLDEKFDRTSLPKMTGEKRLADARAEVERKIEETKEELEEARAEADSGQGGEADFRLAAS
jgi:hypothetical protein